MIRTKITFEFDYRNRTTRGVWCRTGFGRYGDGTRIPIPRNAKHGRAILRRIVKRWTADTELRLVEIATTTGTGRPIRREPRQ